MEDDIKINGMEAFKYLEFTISKGSTTNEEITSRVVWAERA